VVLGPDLSHPALSGLAEPAPMAVLPVEPVRPDAGARILVVEDDVNVRDMLLLLLGTRWTVQAAPHGAAALSAARASPPDLVISDVRMPTVDGITLLKCLRDEPATRDVPVILMSGRAGEQETIAGLEAGADDFVVKPFSARELLVRVQSRLEVTAMRRRNAQQESALASLHRHSRWTERLLDSFPVPLLLLEPGDARIIFANRASLALLGTGLERGQPLEKFTTFRFPDEDGGGVVPGASLAPLSSTSRLHGRRLVAERADGQVWVMGDSDFIPQLYEHRAVSVLTLRDITRLVRQEAELRETVHLREVFISTASHELRTPITSLGLQTEILLRHQAKQGLSDDLRRKLMVIRKQTQRLDQLINLLLDVSRVLAGRLVLAPEEMDLVKVVAEAIDMVRETAEQAGCALVLRGPESVTGRWDRLRLGQVTTNLLSNAIKFGRGAPIEIDVTQSADRARLVVTDHGVGIPLEAQERIFRRFERAAPEHHFPGLGLGLWISKEIVQASQGDIRVESQPGQGASFTVDLPRRS
jgi:signal transduction histidine kinase